MCVNVSNACLELKYLQMGAVSDTADGSSVRVSIDEPPRVAQAGHRAEAGPAVQLGRRGFEHQRYPNRARSSRLRTLPDAVRGRASTNAIARGSLYAASRSRARAT